MNIPAPPPRPRVHWLARLLAAVTVGYAAVLTWATHHPKPEQLLPANPPSDKLLHVGAYAMFGTLVAATLAAAGPLSLRRLAPAALALATFAAVDEATQPWPPFNRSADPLDWACDLAGIALGIAVVWVLVTAARMLRRA